MIISSFPDSTFLLPLTLKLLPKKAKPFLFTYKAKPYLTFYLKKAQAFFIS